MSLSTLQSQEKALVWIADIDIIYLEKQMFEETGTWRNKYLELYLVFGVQILE